MLPNDLAACHAMLREQAQTLESQQIEIAKLENERDATLSVRVPQEDGAIPAGCRRIIRLDAYREHAPERLGVGSPSTCEISSTTSSTSTSPCT
jgi:hypothetical protein